MGVFCGFVVFGIMIVCGCILDFLGFRFLVSLCNIVLGYQGFVVLMRGWLWVLAWVAVLWFWVACF